MAWLVHEALASGCGGSRKLQEEPLMSLALWYDSIPFYFRIFSISTLTLTSYYAQNQRNAPRKLHEPTQSRVPSMLNFH